jgi:hypothetical protein
MGEGAFFVSSERADEFPVREFSGNIFGERFGR